MEVRRLEVGRAGADEAERNARDEDLEGEHRDAEVLEEVSDLRYISKYDSTLLSK